MSLEAELYEERRRKWRRSGFWRGVGAVAVLLIGFAVVGAFTAPGTPSGPYIAQHNIFGIIFNDPARDELIADLVHDEDAKALILYIESPGGTVVGSEGLHDAISRVAEVIPVVAVMGEVAASGGYIAALPADHIIARGNSITGSIGVILEYPNVSGLLETLGVEMETIRSSDAKGGLSPLRDATPAERAAEQQIIDDSYRWFRDLVETGRGLTGAALDAVADGRAFTGRMALDAGLIDGIGGQIEAESWLSEVEPDLADLPIRPIELEPEEDGLVAILDRLAGIWPFERFSDAQSGARLLSVTR